MMFERKIRWGKGTKLVRVKKDKGAAAINCWSVYFVQDGKEEHAIDCVARVIAGFKEPV